MNINPFIELIVAILGMYRFVLVTGIIMSWLIHFNVINLHNGFVRAIYNFTVALTEPLMRKIRKHLPVVFGNFDMSPIVVFLGINLIISMLYTYLYKM